MKSMVGNHFNFYLLVLVLMSSLSGFSQNFEISSDCYDSLAHDDFFVRISGYATFNDSMTFHVNLCANDTTETVVYTGSYDFATATNTLTNFVFDLSNEEFSFEIGNYDSHDFILHLWSEIEGEIREELYIHIDEL